MQKYLLLSLQTIVLSIDSVQSLTMDVTWSRLDELPNINMTFMSGVFQIDSNMSETVKRHGNELCWVQAHRHACTEACVFVI